MTMMSRKPDLGSEDPDDVAAIEYTKNNLGDYKLKSAVATAWCRLAARLTARGYKNAGVAVEALRRAARERDLRRVSLV